MSEDHGVKIGVLGGVGSGKTVLLSMIAYAGLEMPAISYTSDVLLQHVKLLWDSFYHSSTSTIQMYIEKLIDLRQFPDPTKFYMHSEITEKELESKRIMLKFQVDKQRMDPVIRERLPNYFQIVTYDFPGELFDRYVNDQEKISRHVKNKLEQIFLDSNRFMLLIDPKPKISKLRQNMLIAALTKAILTLKGIDKPLVDQKKKASDVDLKMAYVITKGDMIGYDIYVNPLQYCPALLGYRLATRYIGKENTRMFACSAVGPVVEYQKSIVRDSVAGTEEEIETARLINDPQPHGILDPILWLLGHDPQQLRDVIINRYGVGDVTPTTPETSRHAVSSQASVGIKKDERDKKPLRPQGRRRTRRPRL